MRAVLLLALLCAAAFAESPCMETACTGAGTSCGDPYDSGLCCGDKCMPSDTITTKAIGAACAAADTACSQCPLYSNIKCDTTCKWNLAGHKSVCTTLADCATENLMMSPAFAVCEKTAAADADKVCQFGGWMDGYCETDLKCAAGYKCTGNVCTAPVVPARIPLGGACSLTNQSLICEATLECDPKDSKCSNGIAVGSTCLPVPADAPTACSVGSICTKATDTATESQCKVPYYALGGEYCNADFMCKSKNCITAEKKCTFWQIETSPAYGNGPLDAFCTSSVECGKNMICDAGTGKCANGVGAIGDSCYKNATLKEVDYSKCTGNARACMCKDKAVTCTAMPDTVCGVQPMVQAVPYMSAAQQTDAATYFCCEHCVSEIETVSMPEFNGVTGMTINCADKTISFAKGVTKNQATNDGIPAILTKCPTTSTTTSPTTGGAAQVVSSVLLLAIAAVLAL